MVFTRFVEVGRVVLFNYGPDAGKLATIVDVVDSNKCLVEGPASLTGVARQVITYRRLNLTDLKVKVPRSARAKTVAAAWKKADTMASWTKTAWANKLEDKKKRKALDDFGRFKVMVARKQKSVIVKKQVKAMSKK